MEKTVKSRRLRIGGMTCTNCQNKIEKKLRGTAGVISAKVSYGTGTADVTYDTDLVSFGDLRAVIEKLGYRVLADGAGQGPGFGRVAGTLTIIVSLYVLLQRFGVLNLLVPSRLAETGAGYGMLFVIGLLTSVHCVAMCGGINLSQCIPHGPERDGAISEGGQKGPASAFAPAFMYNLGRVISYTAVGFVLGLAGSIFGGGSGTGLPTLVQGILKIAAGVFMVLMGINMLGLFPGLRRFQPKLPKLMTRKARAGKAKGGGPLAVGLLNGLMPCGPLQSMQIVALASGNPFTGALSMLMFSLGTVPLMLGLGSLVTALGRRFADRVTRAGSVLVVVLGLAMLSQGGSLSGLLSPELLLTVILALCAVGAVSSIHFKKTAHRNVFTSAATAMAIVAVVLFSAPKAAGSGAGNENSVNVEDGRQVVSSTLSSGSYPNITVRAGMPVKWTIDAPDGSINGCNYKINIQKFGISNYAFETGENVIEFTPEEPGTYSYSCWMGMIRGTITVTDASGQAPGGSAAAGDGAFIAGAQAPNGAGVAEAAGDTPSCCG